MTIVGSRENLLRLAESFEKAADEGSTYVTIEDGGSVIFRIHIGCESNVLF